MQPTGRPELPIEGRAHGARRPRGDARAVVLVTIDTLRADAVSYAGSGKVETFGTGTGWTWTFNTGTTDPYFTFADNGLTIGGAATLTATDVTTLNLGTSAVISSAGTALNLQTDGAVDVNLAGGSGSTGCTIANSTGNLTCTGDLTMSGNDISFGNGEKIVNTTDGTIEFNDGTNMLAQVYDNGTNDILSVLGGISTYDTDVSSTGYIEASGLCLGDNTNCITSWTGAGFNYWTLTAGALTPDITQGASVIAGTSP